MFPSVVALPVPEPQNHGMGAHATYSPDLRPQSPDDQPSGRQQHSAAPYADYHRLCLTISIGVLVLACLLHVRTDQRVSLGLLPNWPLPEVCQSKVLLGLDCPGCGLTRSFIHLAHGDLAASLAVHSLGWLVALFVAAQIPYRLWALRSPTGAPLGERLPWIIAITTIVLLLANWITRLLT